MQNYKKLLLRVGQFSHRLSGFRKVKNQVKYGSNGTWLLVCKLIYCEQCESMIWILPTLFEAFNLMAIRNEPLPLSSMVHCSFNRFDSMRYLLLRYLQWILKWNFLLSRNTFSSDSSVIGTQNYLVRKRTLIHLATLDRVPWHSGKTIECGFTLKLVRDMIIRHTHNTAQSFRPVWLNGWVFVYKLSSCGFESHCCHLNFRYGICFEQGVPWQTGKAIECGFTLKLVRDMIIRCSHHFFSLAN